MNTFPNEGFIKTLDKVLENYILSGEKNNDFKIN